MKIKLTVFFLIVVQFCFGQVDSISSNGFYIPKNIDECNMVLNNILGKKAKEKLKLAGIRDLRNIKGLFILDEWFENDSTRLAYYFNQLSITSQDFGEREFLTVLSYHKFINNQPFDITFESKKFTNRRDSIQREREYQKEERYKVNIIANSIDGVFIPTDLNSCFIELNRLLNDTIKQEIRNNENSFELVGQYHMGLGRWMRNAWGLWGGSRLQVYFHDRKIFHPDEISSIILESYAKYLNDEVFDSDEIISIIHIQHEEFMRNLELKSTIVFKAPKIKYPRNYRRFLKTGKINDINVEILSLTQ
ncbi:hypothetical protein FACS1894178_7940 [Bacteroidia bacterium]|nr:hypothetical protein FACS1894178_7940 [Bacteroidia bacterium]